MKISILTLGTRGDVEPYIALGRGLAEAGYSVTLGTSRDFAEEVSAKGLSFAPFRLSIRNLLDGPGCRAAFVSKRAALRMYRRVATMMGQLLGDAFAAAQGAHLLIFHPKIINGLDIAEKLRIPAMLGFYLPAFSPTPAFPSPLVPALRSWGGPLNKATHRAFLWLMTSPYSRMLNRWRTSVGLPRKKASQTRHDLLSSSVIKLYGYSRHLVPTPPDWDSSSVVVTGHWFLDAPVGYEPPDSLARFLAAGPPPVLIGFGSIAAVDPISSTLLILEGVRQAGERAVIVSGWGGLPAIPQANSNVLFVDSVPYGWVLPRVAAAVHHGGAGSTAQGLLAGRPTVICPFFGDQFFWGRRVHDLGVGPMPIPQKHLTPKALAAAIQQAVRDGEMRKRTEHLAERMREERGVSNAVRFIQQHVSSIGP